MNELIQTFGFEKVFWALVLFYALVMAFFCHKLAEEKGFDEGYWFFAGFLFGIFALIAAAGLPDKKLRRDLSLFLLRDAGRMDAPSKSGQTAEGLSISPHLKKAAASPFAASTSQLQTPNRKE